MKSKSQIGKNSNFELGQIRNSKITFDFLKQLEKTPNMKVVQLFKPYNFHVDHFSKFQIDFELDIQIGKRDNSWKIVFSKLL